MENTKSIRLDALDGLRGLAATTVVFYHGILHNDASLIERVLFPPLQALTGASDYVAKIALMIFNGESAVFLFFCLSGCVLNLSLSRSKGPALEVAARFVVVRFLRLMPTLWVCLLVYYAMSRLAVDFGVSGFPRFTLDSLFGNLSLMDTAMHGPSFTIKAEAMAVPFILAAFFARRMLGVAALFLCLIYSIYAISADWLVFSLPMMHAYLIAFMAGMLVSEKALCPLFENAHPCVPWLTAAAFIVLPGLLDHASLPRLVGFVLTAALLVGFLAHRAAPQMQAALTWRPILFLGHISYSLYLWNVVALSVIIAATDRISAQGAFPVTFGLGVGAASLLLTIPIAALSEKFVEQPSIAFGKVVSNTLTTVSFNWKIVSPSQGSNKLTPS